MTETSVPSSFDRRAFFTALAAGSVLAGCANLIGPDTPPGQIYMLSPHFPAAAGAMRLPFQLAVSLPAASAALATNRIAILRGGTLDYYADAQWPDAVPGLVQSLLVGGLEAGGALQSVAREDQGIRADYILQSEVVDFDARYDQPDAPPTAVIALTVKLVSASGGIIAAAQSFRQEAPASANSIAAAVAAFDEAATALLAAVVPWVFAQSESLARPPARR